MIARLAYAALFAVLLPAVLIAWAARLDSLLSLPVYGTPAAGWTVAAIGIALMLVATQNLWTLGGGLPASPFPPQRFVSRGVYGIVAHPIYIGAVVASAGLSLAARSAAGLWIVTPTLALAIAAWVIGFERDATRARFGAQRAPFVSLSPATDEAPAIHERFALLFLVQVPWFIVFEAVEFLGPGPDVRSTFSGWDAALPVIPWTEAIYFSTYVTAIFAPFVVRTRHDLRRLALDGLWATAIVIPLYLALPLVAQAKPVPGDGFWETLLRIERTGDGPVTAFPAFHVVWAAIAARAWARRFPRWRWPLALLVVLTGASCVTTGMHSAADVLAGAAAWIVVENRAAIWSALVSAAEWVANSWREVQLGPVRLMNHGIYTAVGMSLAVGVGTALAGADQLWWLMGAAAASLLGAALWAQVVEGSPQLLRPYGYFGSVVGLALYAVVVTVLRGDGWLVLTAATVGGAFGQPVGRLRCLVQGCCHGRAVNDAPGIRYSHPRSRVTRLSELGGVPVHPTPLYSMVWTLLVGALLVRLWSLHAPLAFIVGAYLILIGAGRFVEEHFRGEPQTRVVGGLRMYQWLAIAMIVAGGAVTGIHSPAAADLAGFDFSTLPALAGLLVASYAAYGVDFPASSRRFSRLV